MERWHRPPARHRRSNPSFSSSLLDSIYRSIDESDGGILTGGTPDPSAKTTPPTTYIRKPPPVIEPPVTRLNYFSTSSSSSSSSYSAGFSSSSSDAESATARPKPIRTDRVLTRSERIRPDPLQEKKKLTSIKKKLQDLRKSTSPKLTGFLNSLFTSASNAKKPKITADEPSPCSSASSYTRSCLSKTPSTRGSNGSNGGKRSVRSVRFCPVSVIVGEDCRPCGEKFVFDGELSAAEGVRERRKKMMEELMRGFEMEDDESDGSEDLFELENLGGVSGKFNDELPVYETTDLGMNRAIAKGLVV